jgi:Flp pilus assembly protein TadG
MGLEVRITGFILKDFRLSNKLCAEVYNYTHMENGTNHHTHARVRVASRLQPFSNLAKNVHEKVDKLPGNATTIYPSAIVPVSRTSQSQLVTWLVTPICDMWFV